MMKRMIYIWFLLIVILFGAGFFRPDWSITVNDWAKSALILLLLLLCIEIGLYFWRRKMLDLSRLVKNSQSRDIRTEQEEHYVPPTNSA